MHILKLRYWSRGRPKTDRVYAGGGNAKSARSGLPHGNGWRDRLFLSSSGVIKSFDKRPVSVDQIRQLADEVEREVRRKEATEISSKAIGKMVLKRLKNIDKVAWIRFASVYFELTDLTEFEKLFEKIS